MVEEELYMGLSEEEQSACIKKINVAMSENDGVVEDILSSLGLLGEKCYMSLCLGVHLAQQDMVYNTDESDD